MKKIILSLFLVSNVFVLFGQNGVEWSTLFGGFSYDEADAMCETSDGGFFVVGYSDSNDDFIVGGNGFKDLLLVKYSNEGVPLWHRTYGGTFNEQAFDIRPTSDGNYFIVGRSESNNGDCTINWGGTDAWVLKINEQGDIIWQRSVGGGSADAGYSIRETADGGCLVSGYTYSNNLNITDAIGNGDLWLFKLTSDGSLEWSNAIGSTGTEFGSELVDCQDGNFLLIGSFSVSSNDLTVSPYGSNDVLVLKITPTGEIIWQQHYGGTGLENYAGGVALPDGSFAIAAITRSSNMDINAPNQGSDDIWVFRIDAFGNLIWSTTRGGVDQDLIKGIVLLPDGKIVVTGEVLTPFGDMTSNGLIDTYIGVLDWNGNILYEDLLGGSQWDYNSSIFKSDNNELFLVGHTWSNDGDVNSVNQGYRDFWLTKYTIQFEECNGTDDDGNGLVDDLADFDGDGYSFCDGDCDESNDMINPGALEIVDNLIDENCDGNIATLIAEKDVYDSFYVYPNPTSAIANIFVSDTRGLDLEISNCYGQLMYKDKCFSELVSINCEDWPNGTYIVRYNGEVSRLIVH